MPAPEEIDPLELHARCIRESSVLGRSELMRRLFDFLVECASRGRVPKEIEVAIDGFGKGADFDASQDALVRVYVHKLRRKLEEFYASEQQQPGLAGAEGRLVIPKGEYRLAFEPASAAPVTEQGTVARARRFARLPHWTREHWLAGIAGAIVALAVAAALLWSVNPAGLRGADGADAKLAALRASPIWAPLLDDDLPIHLVVGDYYVFGERGRFDGVDRLVRDFSINSREDLERVLQQDAQAADRYLDVDLGYLPTGAAFALRDVMPVLARANKRVRVMLASDMDPVLFKSGHVVYVGYLSGLGMLREIVFAGSRFSIGMSFDELIDSRTGTQYVSEAAGAAGETPYRDYGYLSTFAGPAGNRYVIIAGTRDTALMQVAESATTPARLAELDRPEVTGVHGLEALYEVYGVLRTNLRARLLLVSPIDAKGLWDEGWRSASAAPAAAAGPHLPEAVQGR